MQPRVPVYIKCGFMLKYLTLISYHMEYSSFLPLLFCQLPLQQLEIWLPPLNLQLLNYSIPVYMYNGINLYSVGKLYQLDYSAYVSSIMPFILEFTRFQCSMVSDLSSYTL